MAVALGIDPASPTVARLPVIAVVGSKGKGTAAVYASATLAAAGLRVGTLTSPGFLSNRERIRVDGMAIPESSYAALSRRIEMTLDAVAEKLPVGGYLSPTGLFTLAAVRYFLETGCDVVVLEAGMGGISDEISLFAPTVVCVTAIFSEHLGILGDSVAEIAANKLGIIGPATRAVVSVVQPDDGVARQVEAAASHASLDVVRPTDAPPTLPWPAQPVGSNAQAGVAAAQHLLAHMGRDVPDVATSAAVWRTIALPGRLSLHRTANRTWGVDAAINATGARAALTWFEAQVGPPDTILVCVPDDKDRAGVLEALVGQPFLEVRVAAHHLNFELQSSHPLFASVDEVGHNVLALGTISFVGEVLDRLGVAADRAYAVATPATSGAGPAAL